jgi:hypothetical protein
MSNGTTKPKPRPRSVKEWREKRKNRYGNDGRNGGFRILPRRVLDSDAFNELTKSAKLVLILSLDQLDYWYKKKYKGEFKRLTTVGPLRNDGRFSLPSNLLKERGITSSDTIAKTRREPVAAGFGRPWKQERFNSPVYSDGQIIGSPTTREAFMIGRG